MCEADSWLGMSVRDYAGANCKKLSLLITRGAGIQNTSIGEASSLKLRELQSCWSYASELKGWNARSVLTCRPSPNKTAWIAMLSCPNLPPITVPGEHSAFSHWGMGVGRQPVLSLFLLSNALNTLLNLFILFASVACPGKLLPVFIVKFSVLVVF